MRIRNEDVFENLQMCIDRIEGYIETRENPLTPFEKGGIPILERQPFEKGGKLPRTLIIKQEEWK